MNQIADLRKEYTKASLELDSIDVSPFAQFRKWFDEAVNSELLEPNAFVLSTVSEERKPFLRTVLMKALDDKGVVFYTNYKSEKGLSIESNNKVSLSFFWPNMERQIIIKGIAAKTSEIDAINYFHSRPRGSQLGALVSNQSNVIPSRLELENELKSLEIKFENKEVPKPKNWGGYVVSPVEFEFWQGRPNRLHDRIRYTLNDLDWNINRLAP